MSNAYEVKIADAVAAEMNDPARPWATLFATTYGTSAIRSWLPVYGTDPEEAKTLLETLRIAVVPWSIRSGPDKDDTRKEKQYDYEIWVNFQKLVDLASNVAADALSYLAEQVHEFFQEGITGENDGHELAALAGWHVVETDRAKVCDLDRLYAEQVWDTSILLTVRGWK